MKTSRTGFESSAAADTQAKATHPSHDAKGASPAGKSDGPAGAAGLAKSNARANPASDAIERVGGGASATGQNKHEAAIVNAFTRGLPKLYEKAQRKELSEPAVALARRAASDSARAGGVITLTYTTSSAAKAAELVGDLGGSPDNSNLITDDLSKPDTVDYVNFAAHGRDIVFTIDWTEPAGQEHAAVEEAFSGAATKLIRTVGPQLGMNIDAYGPTLDERKPNGTTLIYEIISDHEFVSDETAKKVAEALAPAGGVNKLQTNLKLPDFVRSVTTRADGHNLLIDVSW